MTTRRWLAAIVVTALLSVVATIFVQRRFPRDRVGSAAPAGTLQGREYFVHLPAGYDPARPYPVLYVLDGGSQAGHTAESASLLARVGVLPPVIVVGIAGGDTRDRDYTPPGDWRSTSPFLSFLQTELVPHIEREYRTTRPRMLAGWSRGGMFVLYSQIAAPALFDARFAHSPFIWSDEDDRAVTRFEQGLSATAAAPSFLYLSLGDQETQTMQPFRRAVRVLETRAPQTLRWRADVSAGGDHGSNPRLSAPVGLCAMFNVGGGRSFD